MRRDDSTMTLSIRKKAPYHKGAFYDLSIKKVVKTTRIILHLGIIKDK